MVISFLPKRKQKSFKVEKSMNQFAKNPILLGANNSKEKCQTEHQHRPDNEYLFKKWPWWWMEGGIDLRVSLGEVG